MKRMVLVGALVLLSLFCINTMAEVEDDLSFEITTDFFGKYIWRGQNLNDDPVFQPGVSMTYKNFTFGFWGNLDFTNINDRSGNFSELDVYFDYSDDLPGFESVGYSLGFIYYKFPGSGAGGGRVPDTTEFYWGLNFDTFLSPAVTIYHDLDEAEGTYVNLSLSYSYDEIFKIGDVPVGLELGTGIGWASGSYNKYYWGTDQSKMQDLSFSVAFPMELGSWSVTPSLNYVTLLSDDIRDTDVYSTDSDYFYAGVSISTSF